MRQRAAAPGRLRVRRDQHGGNTASHQDEPPGQGRRPQRQPGQDLAGSRTRQRERHHPPVGSALRARELIVSAIGLKERGCSPAATVQPPTSSTGATADETTPHHAPHDPTVSERAGGRDPLRGQRVLVSGAGRADGGQSPCQLRQRNAREALTRPRKDRCHLARLRPKGRTTVIADERTPRALCVGELLAQDVGVPAVLGEFAQLVQVDPAQRERAAAVAVDDVVQAQG
jgi:hypothetical protein